MVLPPKTARVGRGQKERGDAIILSYQPPTILHTGIHVGWEMRGPLERTLRSNMGQARWLARDNLEINSMTISASGKKNPHAIAGDLRDMGSIPGSGRSPGGGHSNPLLYSCLENLMDRGSWQATAHRIANSWTRLKQLSTSNIKPGTVSQVAE